MHSIPVLVLCTLLLPACASYGPEYRELLIPGAGAGDIYRQIEMFADSRGFRPDPLETDTGKRIYQSKWQGGSGSFRRALRRRLRAEVIAADEGWQIKYFVEVQIVSELNKAQNPEEDDWEESGQDLTKEQEFHRVMVYRFDLLRGS